jgi:undecaprenyl-diphosphatase
MGKKAHTLSLTFACLMGFSRMYLYVHYPTDVLAGAFFGTLCGLLALFLWKKIIGRDKI